MIIVTLPELLRRKACIDAREIEAFAQRWPREHWRGDVPAVDLAWLLSDAATVARSEYAAAMVEEHGAALDRLKRPWTEELRASLVDRITREQTQWCTTLLPCHVLHEAQRRLLVDLARGPVAEDLDTRGVPIFPAVLRALPDSASIGSVRLLAASICNALDVHTSATQLRGATRHTGKGDDDRQLGYLFRCVHAIGPTWRDQLTYYQRAAEEEHSGD